MASTSDRLSGFRKRKDVFFKEHDQSPLTPEQRKAFRGLSHFEENPDLRLILDLDTSGEGIGEDVTIGTVSGEAKQYTRAGRVSFDVEGERVTLTVFRERTRGHLFMPFRDATAGNETYGVGRYLEPKLLPDGRISLDLNLAYNPYCAYNHGWSCPIPPFENIVKVPIKAGERLPDLPPANTPAH
ncbi:MAG: DUF1684 domain-containing protein [Chloroflexia bacterium]|nr:DUF1684 domain-containing protein [Chloroflexia bacterium]